MSEVKGEAPPPASYNAPPPTTNQPQGVPPPGYAPQPSTTVVVQQPMIGMPMGSMLGKQPCTVQCPHCNQTVLTRVSYVTGTGTWVAVGVIALIGFWCGCCLIPLCVNGAKDVEHHCTNCQKYIGIKKLME